MFTLLVKLSFAEYVICTLNSTGDFSLVKEMVLGDLGYNPFELKSQL